MSTTVGLDIGYETVKLIGLDHSGGRWRLHGITIAHCPANSWQPDALKNTDELAKVVRETMRLAKPAALNTKKVMIALPESVIFSSTFAMPSMSDAELKQALPFEIADKLSIEIEEFYYDYEEVTSRCKPISTVETSTKAAPEKADDKKTSKDEVVEEVADSPHPNVTIFSVAARKTLIQSVMEMCAKAGLELAGIDIKPGAIARAVIPQDDQKARLVVDMGVGGTGASIAEGKSLRVTSTVPWGTHTIAKDITGPVDNFRQVAAPVFDELVHITKFFENRVCPGIKIEEIIISGTGANIPGIVDVFKQETGLPTRLAEPFGQIDTHRFPIPKDMTHTFSDAIGLAMRK